MNIFKKIFQEIVSLLKEKDKNSFDEEDEIKLFNLIRSEIEVRELPIVIDELRKFSFDFLKKDEETCKRQLQEFASRIEKLNKALFLFNQSHLEEIDESFVEKKEKSIVKKSREDILFLNKQLYTLMEVYFDCLEQCESRFKHSK